VGPYDNRSVTLDPGLTVLALRGLKEREGHYPFIERFRRRQRRRVKAASAPAAEPRSSDASGSLSLWSLLAPRRPRTARDTTSAAA
jgi:hypothetical protein